MGLLSCSSSEADESEAALVVETGALLQNTGDNAQTTGEIVKTEVLPPVERYVKLLFR